MDTASTPPVEHLAGALKYQTERYVALSTVFPDFKGAFVYVNADSQDFSESASCCHWGAG